MAHIIIFLFWTLFSTAGGLHHHRRRLLHQPFFPVEPISVQPSQPPSPLPSPSRSPQPQAHHQQLPKYPFSTTPPSIQQKPFFPSYHSPPSPPPPSVQSTFPANISSLLFPHRPSSTHRHFIILAITLSLFSAAIIIAVSAIFLYLRTRHRNHSNKNSVSDSQRLFPPNLTPSYGNSKTETAHGNVSSSNQPSTSSEFLYLGTLKNSRSQEIPPDTGNVGVKFGVSLAKSPPGYQKLGSPDLKPLPPLPKHNPGFTSGNMYLSKDEDDVKCETTEEEDEEEQFFSPRSSSGLKESRQSPTPARIGSSSRRENFGSRSFNSRTASYPYSHSCSPANSITSSCHSPARNLSPHSMKSRFLENVNSLSISSSSFLSRSDSGDTQNSPDMVSNSSGKNKQSPARFVPIKLPPPPPPPPPPRFWEIPAVARRSSGPPVLVAPQRDDVANGLLNKNEDVEKSEETLLPKLKPLHWDKVRASSDRVMVWDQLKSSSFQ